MAPDRPEPRSAEASVRTAHGRARRGEVSAGTADDAVAAEVTGNASAGAGGAARTEESVAATSVA